VAGVSPDQAKKSIRACGSDGRLMITQTAEQRLRRDGVTLRDVRQALSTAFECTPQTNGNWSVKGRDLDGEDLALVVTLANRAVVVL
jgi:hypothetical protein